MPPPAIASAGTSGPTLLALSDSNSPETCDSSYLGTLVVYALDAAGNGEATMIDDGSTEYITSLAFVPHHAGATLIYGRVTEAFPAVNGQGVLWMVSFDAQGLPIAPPKPLELEGISSTRNAVVRMAGGGFAVARWVADTIPLPEEWPFAISLFDRDGSFLQELPIAETNQVPGWLFGAPRAVASPDGRSAFFAWPEEILSIETDLKVLRLDCVD
ncbi:MAG: hypothetical protein HOV80_02915 [Polyangiaceae bacterium]|nr:hypothetical protein [Polyangiaceae bacterium]